MEDLICYDIEYLRFEIKPEYLADFHKFIFNLDKDNQYLIESTEAIYQVNIKKNEFRVVGRKRLSGTFEYGVTAEQKTDIGIMIALKMAKLLKFNIFYEKQYMN
jgi:hypothetical protein